MKLFKTAVFVIVTLFALNSYALTYTTNGTFFPNESSPEGLPEALPCLYDKVGSTVAIQCVWMSYSRDIYVPGTQGRPAKTQNMLRGVCRVGKCRTELGEYGTWPENANLIISTWYYLTKSIDGRPIAVRRDLNRQFTYPMTGMILLNWYLEMGADEKAATAEFDQHYQGGHKQFGADVVRVCKQPDSDFSCGE